MTTGSEVFEFIRTKTTSSAYAEDHGLSPWGSIPVSVKHRLEKPGLIPLRIIEIQSRNYVEEDDIQRLDDDYGR
jgi:hypothetical protein